MGDEDDDGKATRVWLGSDDEPIELPPNRVKWYALGGLGLCVLAILVIVLTRGSSAENLVKSEPAAAATTDMETPAAVEARPWKPPSGPTRLLKLSAVGMPSVDESDLGRLFDANLQPISGGPNLFISPRVTRIARNAMTGSYTRVENQLELRINVMALIGGGYRRDRFYATYRAQQVGDVLRVDDRGAMAEPPARASYYLAELHIGSSYEVLIEGTSRDMGAQLSRELAEGTLDLKVGNSDSNYRFWTKTLGLKPRSGDAIFATTKDAVARQYTTAGAAVPVELVFRQIPGRKLPSDAVQWPSLFMERELTIGEGKTQHVQLPAGTYSIELRSRPNGVVIKWSSGSCKEGGFEQLTTICKLPVATDLSLENWRGFFPGPTETVSLSIQRGIDPSLVESSVSGK